MRSIGSTFLLNLFTEEQHRSANFSGSYKDILSYLHEYFRLMVLSVELTIPELVRRELSMAIKELCNPDPSMRGHPKNVSAGNRYDLQRYISLFNKLTIIARNSMGGPLL